MQKKQINETADEAKLRDDARPWTKLQNRFLEALDDTEQEKIFDLSERLAQALNQWATRYPLIRQVRVLPLSLSVAAAAPFSRLEALVSTARMSLWVFALDDLFDEEGWHQEKLMLGADRYRAVAMGQPPVPAEDALADALHEIRDDLASYPLFTQLKMKWEQALLGTIDEMIREYHWRLQYRRVGVTMLPSYQEYLDSGRFSIGGPPHVWAALISANDPSTPQHLQHLHSMERLASICIRLANDLQTHVKETSEGKINSLVILSHRYQQDGLSVAESRRRAESRVRDDISLNLKRLSQLLSQSRTETGQPEQLITNIAHFVCDFYEQYDYHTFAKEDS